LQDAFGDRLVVSTHPRLRNRLKEFNLGMGAAGFELCEPFGYFDYNQLQRNARCVVSNSGTISEESAIMGLAAVTIRNAMERLEAIDAGSMILTGTNAAGVTRAVRLVVDDWTAGRRPSVPPRVSGERLLDASRPAHHRA
jgi:UDP-N-acetylglucosamine 2-epimerase (non-hydrolysing)